VIVAALWPRQRSIFTEPGKLPKARMKGRFSSVMCNVSCQKRSLKRKEKVNTCSRGEGDDSPSLRRNSGSSTSSRTRTRSVSRRIVQFWCRRMRCQCCASTKNTKPTRTQIPSVGQRISMINFATPVCTAAGTALLWRDSTTDDFGLLRSFQNTDGGLICWPVRPAAGNIHTSAAIHLPALLSAPSLKRGAPC
jgi:hypothetical protein